MSAYQVIVADPPWSFADKLPGKGRGASKHYNVTSASEIARMVLPFDVARDAVLFLWRVSSQVEEAYRVCRAWGFLPKSEIVWVKTTAKSPPMLSPHLAMGMGRSVRASHESCIVAVRGKPQRISRSQRSVFMAPRGAHSEKPDEFFRIVERLYPGPYVEVFARKHRPGWTVIGDELGTTLDVRAA